MDKKDTDSQSIVFKIEEKRVTIDIFSQRVRRFFNIIEDVATVVTGKTKALDWLISVKPGTITFVAKPESINGSPELGRKTVAALKNGFQAINERRHPKHFSDFTLSNLFAGLKIGIGKTYYKISPQSIVYIDEILGTVSEAYGTVEGKLQALKIRGKPNFSIWETLTGKEIKCFFDYEVYNDVISAINKRVLVYGLIHYNKRGRPLRVEIKKLTEFPDDNDLPKFKDIIGLFKD